jgi:hypothetical protein
LRKRDKVLRTSPLRKALGDFVRLRKHVPFAGATTALLLAIFAFWTAPALTASLLLTFLAAPLALICGILGSPRTASMALYFSLAAWLPFLLSRHGIVEFGSALHALLAGGVVLAAALFLELRIRAGAT